MAAGGYGSDSFAEDMDMLLRIMGYCCENNIDYRVVQIPRCAAEPKVRATSECSTASARAGVVD